MPSFGPTVLRLALAAVFIAHGAQKLFGVWGGAGLSGTAAFFAEIGLTPAFPLAMLVGLTELTSGLLLLAGAFTRPVALVLLMTMVVAVWKVHLPNGFFLNWTNAPGAGHGYEYNLVIIAALVSLALTGPGAVAAAQGARLKAQVGPRLPESHEPPQP